MLCEIEPDRECDRVLRAGRGAAGAGPVVDRRPKTNCSNCTHRVSQVYT